MRFRRNNEEVSEEDILTSLTEMSSSPETETLEEDLTLEFLNKMIQEYREKRYIYESLEPVDEKALAEVYKRALESSTPTSCLEEGLYELFADDKNKWIIEEVVKRQSSGFISPTDFQIIIDSFNELLDGVKSDHVRKLIKLREMIKIFNKKNGTDFPLPSMPSTS